MRPQAASLGSHGHSFGANAEVFMKKFLQMSLGRERKACAFGPAPDAEGLFCPKNLISAAGKNGAQFQRPVKGCLLINGRDKPGYRTGSWKTPGTKFSRHGCRNQQNRNINNETKGIVLW